MDRDPMTLVPSRDPSLREVEVVAVPVDAVPVITAISVLNAVLGYTQEAWRPSAA